MPRSLCKVLRGERRRRSPSARMPRPSSSRCRICRSRSSARWTRVPIAISRRTASGSSTWRQPQWRRTGWSWARRTLSRVEGRHGGCSSRLDKIVEIFAGVIELRAGARPRVPAARAAPRGITRSARLRGVAVPHRGRRHGRCSLRRPRRWLRAAPASSESVDSTIPALVSVAARSVISAASGG